MDIDQLLGNCEGFEWDEGNRLKSWLKHGVTQGEAEQVFFNQPLLVADDVAHSVSEKRFWALGQTDEKRCLFVTFVIRKDRLRVVSARDANRKEKGIYEKSEDAS